MPTIREPAAPPDVPPMDSSPAPPAEPQELLDIRPRKYADFNDGSEAEFIPWTDGYAIGFKCIVNGATTYVKLNPSTGGDSPDVFLYHDNDEEEPSDSICFVGFPAPKRVWRLLDANGSEVEQTASTERVAEFVAAMMAAGLGFSAVLA